MKKGMSGLVASVFLFVSQSLFAASLIEVYQDACANDPTFKLAKADFDAAKQALPLSVANFLPTLDLTGALQRTRNDNQTGANPFDTDSVYYNNTTTYDLRATQSVFNYTNWALLATAKASVKQAAATYCAAAQDLMLRTSFAYFAVLNASESLRFLEAEKQAIGKNLAQIKERFKVGLIAITGVHEAQASYDTTLAREIDARFQLASRIEELHEITNKYYPSLMGAGREIELVRPVPNNIHTWVEIAEKQNYQLQAAQYGAQAARENVKVQFSGHLPTVNASGGFNYRFQDNPFGGGLESRNKTWDVALSGDLPILRGGATVAQTRQARAQYVGACAIHERTHRSVVSGTRTSFLGVISGISQIKADRQTLVSRRSALEATEAAYEVGTRTEADVLDAQSDLYDAERVKTLDVYTYLYNTLRLKQASGSLSPADLAMIQRRLNKRVDIKKYDNL